MISDERLKRAAGLAGDIIISDLEACDEPEHSFSPEFEQRIEKLSRRLKSGRHMTAWQRAACFFLALLVGTGVWLTVDTDARAEVFGWIKEQYEAFFHYHFEGDDTGEKQEYELGWVPDGYTLKESHKREDGCTLIYSQEDNRISFGYKYSEGVSNADMFLFRDGYVEILPSEVNGIQAEFYFSPDGSERNAFVWINDDQTLFTILGYFDEAEMIKMAESVVPKR